MYINELGKLIRNVIILLTFYGLYYNITCYNIIKIYLLNIFFRERRYFQRRIPFCWSIISESIEYASIPDTG